MERQQTKVCIKCGVEKPFGEFARNFREPDKKCQKCVECVELERLKSDEKAAAAIAFVQEICRRPGHECLSKSKTKPCHGCSLSHKAKVDDGFRESLKAAGSRGLLVIASDPQMSEARAERMRNLFRDPVFAAAHADRNRKKIAEIEASEDVLARKRAGTIRHNKSDRMIELSAQRFADSDFQTKRAAGLAAYHERRRENEAYEAFMARMEQEAEEFIGPIQPVGNPDLWVNDNPENSNG